MARKPARSTTRGPATEADIEATLYELYRRITNPTAPDYDDVLNRARAQLISRGHDVDTWPEPGMTSAVVIPVLYEDPNYKVVDRGSKGVSVRVYSDAHVENGVRSLIEGHEAAVFRMLVRKGALEQLVEQAQFHCGYGEWQQVDDVTWIRRHEDSEALVVRMDPHADRWKLWMKDSTGELIQGTEMKLSEARLEVARIIAKGAEIVSAGPLF